MPQRLPVDVCVIGGGPAGATVAARLGAMGHAVALLEACAFPRPHIGASLPTGMFPLLEQVGVLDAVARAGFVRAALPIVKWPDLRTPPVTGTPAGLHIDRGRFDHTLLDHARQAGVRVFETARAARPRKCPDTGRWLIAVHGNNTGFEVSARIVIDASGRQTTDSRPFSAPTIALYAYWQRARGMDFAGRLDAGDSEWMWCAPVGHSQAIAAVFLAPKRLSGLDRCGVAQLYRSLIKQSELIAPCLQHGGGEAVHGCDATTRACSRHATRDFIRVGDASLKLDPLSSQGIQTAIAAAIQAAIVCNTLLVRASAADAAVSFYEARQRERLEQHRIKAGALYAEVAARYDNPFWISRSASRKPEEPLRVPPEPLTPMTCIALAPDVRFEPVPVIEQDIIVSRAAVRTSAMPRPVAYLAGIDLVSVLKTTNLNGYAHAAVQDLARRFPEDLSWDVMRWLWDQHIIVPHGHERTHGSEQRSMHAGAV